MLKNKLKQLRRVLGADIEDDNVTAELEPDTPVTLDIDGIEHEVTSIQEIIPTDTEKEEMNVEIDEGYLQYSSEVVGFENRELQWNAYRTITSFIDSESVIDFGCGRGDYVAYWKSETPDTELNYTGVDMNKPLITAGKEIYPDINLIESDWFNLDEDLMHDWAINVGSNNLRYDADTTKSDLEYTKNTIQAMFKHCTRGVVTMLASSYTATDDGLINYNPGEMLNWAKEEFGNVAVDHSLGDDVFILIIYKV